MARKRGLAAAGPHAEAIAALAAADPTMGALIARVGACGLEADPAGTVFAHLARAIVYQQLSGKAAGTIHGRFAGLFADGQPHPAGLAGLDDDALRAVGLSRQKAAAMRALAEHFAARDLAIADLAGWEDDAIVADLTRIRGVGRWTVEMFLIFRLGRPDVLAVDDLGIQRGIELAWGLPARPKPKEVLARGEAWRPWRSVASWYLWRATELPWPRP